MADDDLGRLTLTLRETQTAVINVNGEEITVKFVKAGGRNKATVQIVADKRHTVTRLLATLEGK